jgi:nucleotidyltransferase substrate binding protein (TIGR01987 family)
MKIDTSFIIRCILALEKAYTLINKSEREEIEYDLYHSACVKEFEIILEQTGKLLKKALKPYFHSPKEVDKLYFKDIFRQAAKYDIIEIDEAERWLGYRDNRNSTAHDYGSGFAEDTIKLIPQFIIDAKSIVKALQEQKNA